jgi:hypothetical protein
MTSVYESEGFPDGCTVDAEGFIWSAHWGGWRITRYDPGGGVDRVVEMPVPNVTSLAFGGTGLDRLFVTTARLGMTDQEIEDAPLSGGLFALDVGVRGSSRGDRSGPQQSARMAAFRSASGHSTRLRPMTISGRLLPLAASTRARPG